jgi:uncharacterized protein
VTDRSEPASDRVRLRRGALRGRYDEGAIRAVLDAGVIAHVGVATDDGPIVLPMAYGHDGVDLFVHGSVANAMLRAAVGHEVCVTVTILDGLIFARSPFHNSANYRSVVVRGVARRLTDPSEHERALRLISDHVVANWDTGRASTAGEIAKTMAVAVSLDEASAKIRDGGPADEPEDLDGPHWGGRIPITTVFAVPEPSPDLPADIPVPTAVADLSHRPVHP